MGSFPSPWFYCCVCLVAQLCASLCNPVDHHAPLQRIFPTQGSDPALPHCRWILYQLSHQRFAVGLWKNHTTMWNFILHIPKMGIFRFGLYSCFENQIRGMGRCFKDKKVQCHLRFEHQKSSEDWCSCPLWLIEDLFETCEPIWFKRNLSGTYSGMATCSCILAWRIPWTEEPGGLQFMGSQRVRHNWSDLACMHALCI